VSDFVFFFASSVTSLFEWKFNRKYTYRAVLILGATSLTLVTGEFRTRHFQITDTAGYKQTHYELNELVRGYD